MLQPFACFRLHVQLERKTTPQGGFHRVDYIESTYYNAAPCKSLSEHCRVPYQQRLISHVRLLTQLCAFVLILVLANFLSNGIRTYFKCCSLLNDGIDDYK